MQSLWSLHLKWFAVGKLSLFSFLAKAEVWEEADIFWHLNIFTNHEKLLMLDRMVALYWIGMVGLVD